MQTTMWESMKNYTRNRCQKWLYILFEAIYRKNKQWEKSIWRILLFLKFSIFLKWMKHELNLSSCVEYESSTAYGILYNFCFDSEGRPLSWIHKLFNHWELKVRNTEVESPKVSFWWWGQNWVNASFSSIQSLSFLSCPRNVAKWPLSTLKRCEPPKVSIVSKPCNLMTLYGGPWNI